MVNEITVGMFEGLGAILIILILYSLRIKDTTLYSHIITSLLATYLSFVMSESILNGNVVTQYADSTGIHNNPIQSLPLHYLLLGLAVIMVFITVMHIIKAIQERINILRENASRSSFAGWDE